MRKLGRRAVKTDSRTLRLGDYLTAALPAPPPSVSWAKSIANWGMFLNDSLGDCTIAGIGHAIQVWTLNARNTEANISDNAILVAYEAWDGYNPADPSTDQGGVELDVLKNWRKSNLAGYALDAFASIDVANLTEVQQAIDLFGGIYIGLELPLTAQDQTVWYVIRNGGFDATPGSWGGHCVYVTGYDAGGFQCITWGQNMKFTTNFWKCYVDEAYCLLSRDWIGTLSAPSGLNLQQLTRDLALIH